MRFRKHWRKPRSRRHDHFANGEIVDPGHDNRAARSGRGDRKVLQLCRQVAETLGLVLSGECDDDTLRSLQVVTVIPVPDASQLLVIVAPAIAGERLDPAEVLNRLAAHSGRLRSDVAAAITRRRAPRLAFQFVSGIPNSA